MKITILKKLILASLLLASQTLLSADKLAPGSDVKMLNLLPGKVYKFDVPGFADDGVYTVSLPWFTGKGIELPPTLNADKYGLVNLSVLETKDALKNVCTGNASFSTLETWLPVTIDGHSACYIFTSSFAANTSPDYSAYDPVTGATSSNAINNSYSLILGVQIAIDNSTLLSLAYSLNLNANKTLPNTTYDYSNQLPVFLANKGVVPEKGLRELARQELPKLLSNIGITKVK